MVKFASFLCLQLLRKAETKRKKERKKNFKFDANDLTTITPDIDFLTRLDLKIR